MSKKIIKGICLVATLLLFTMSMDAATVNGVGKSEKNVWQDSDSSKENYFNNRRALVGPGCVINSLFDGVEVVSGTKDLYTKLHSRYHPGHMFYKYQNHPI